MPEKNIQVFRLERRKTLASSAKLLYCLPELVLVRASVILLYEVRLITFVGSAPQSLSKATA